MTDPDRAALSARPQEKRMTETYDGKCSWCYRSPPPPQVMNKDASGAICADCAAVVNAFLNPSHPKAQAGGGGAPEENGKPQVSYVGGKSELIDARNGLRDAIVKLRGGHSTVVDEADHALAALDIAIGKVGLTTTTPLKKPLPAGGVRPGGPRGDTEEDHD